MEINPGQAIKNNDYEIPDGILIKYLQSPARLKDDFMPSGFNPNVNNPLP
jgi:hypothetical protein